MGLALASSGSVLEPAGTGSVRHWGSCWQLLTEVTPIAPLTTKILPGKPITYGYVGEVTSKKSQSNISLLCKLIQGMSVANPDVGSCELQRFVVNGCFRSLEVPLSEELAKVGLI